MVVSVEKFSIIMSQCTEFFCISIILETDGPSKQVKQVSKTGSRAGLDESEEKYKDRGSQRAAHDSPKVKAVKGISQFRTSPGHINRKLSSPPAPDIMIMRRPVSPEGRPRPVSYNFAETELSESEMSISMTPQHRKLLTSMASAGVGGSPKQERPKVRK